MDPRENKPDGTDEWFESLFDGIEPREEPPEGLRKAVEDHFLAQCERLRAERRKRVRMGTMAVAASVLLALVAVPLWFRFADTNAPVVPAGVIVKSQGEVRIGDQLVRATSGDDAAPVEIHAGALLSTGARSGLSMDWGQGYEHVRVDQRTRLKIVSHQAVELVSGRIYVDASPSRRSTKPKEELRISTPYGEVRHIGTQYIVAVENDQTDVLVREGEVEVQCDSQKQSVADGTKLSIQGDGCNKRTEIPSYGADWEWVETLSLPYEIEGKRLIDFLNWLQRETGRSVEWGSPDVESLAKNTVLHGPNIEVEPMRALGPVLKSVDLVWSEAEGRILISQSH